VFSTRCPYVAERCREERPALRPLDGSLVACHHAERLRGVELTPGAGTIRPPTQTPSQELPT
jgi:hypothetical protein